MKFRKGILTAATLVLSVGPVGAAVTAAEAERLKSDLTPLGAERAGNKDGTIPAWTGGFKGTIAGDSPTRRGDPFKDEKPLYSVSAKNLGEHAGKLSEGVQALLKKYPDSYRLDVYRTHRTALAPQWIYDNVVRNAVNGRLENHEPKGVYGGVPFPIPKSGEEAMWNANTYWRGASWQVDVNQYQITAEGRVVLINDATVRNRMPYYFEDGSADKFDGYFWEVNLVSNAPAIRAGEMVVGRLNFDTAKTSTYVYLTGQRRVRKMPNACCDSPTAATAGLMSYDEIGVFQGKTSIFDYKLVGKKELLIPYNQNRLLQFSESEIIKGRHLNPDAVRWELHRVWVVEAALAAGQRHQAPRSVYYLDEDTWQPILADRWDAKGQLWKSLWSFNYVMPDVPGTVQQSFGFYDVLSGQAFVGNVMNDKKYQQRATSRWPTVTFTPEGLMGQGVR